MSVPAQRRSGPVPYLVMNRRLSTFSYPSGLRADFAMVTTRGRSQAGARRREGRAPDPDRPSHTHPAQLRSSARVNRPKLLNLIIHDGSFALAKRHLDGRREGHVSVGEMRNAKYITSLCQF